MISPDKARMEIEEALLRHVNHDFTERTSILNTHNNELKAQGWDECLEGIWWCLNQDNNFEGALSYVQHNNPYRKD